MLQRDHGRLVVIDEIVLERATTEEACQEFENRYKGHAAALEIFGDASGRNMHTTGTSDYSDGAEIPVQGRIPEREAAGAGEQSAGAESSSEGECDC